MPKVEQIDPVATPPHTLDEERAEADRKGLMTEKGARPDPETGEVPAGPGDAGLSARPTINPGDSGKKQMSNRRLAISVAVALLLAVAVFIVATLFNTPGR